MPREAGDHHIAKAGPQFFYLTLLHAGIPGISHQKEALFLKWVLFVWMGKAQRQVHAMPGYTLSTVKNKKREMLVFKFFLFVFHSV